MPIHLKLFIATVAWGATPTIGRVLASYEAPLVVVCGRFLVATVFLFAFALSRRALVPVARRHWGAFLLLGLSGICLHNGLMYKGLEFTSATTTSIILGLIATQVVLLDVIFFRRVPDRWAVLGVAIAFVGTTYVLTGGRLTELAGLHLGLGELLIFLSGLSWAVYSVVGRRLLELYSPLVVTCYASLAGVVMMLPFPFGQLEVTGAILADPAALAMIFFLGSMGSALGFLWYYEAVVTMGTVGAAVYINLVPMFGLLSAAFFLGEEISASVVGGGALVIGGLMLDNRPARPRWTRVASS